MWSHGQTRRMETTKKRHPTGIKKLSRFDSNNQAHGVPLFCVFPSLFFFLLLLLTFAAPETPARTIDRDTENESHREQDIKIQEQERRLGRKERDLDL